VEPKAFLEALRSLESLLGFGQMARILNGIPVRIGVEVIQSHIQSIVGLVGS
jgi:hypothetical protein